MENQKKKTEETDNFFVMRIKHTLSQSDLIALRRAFGQPLIEASGAALAAFYLVCPKDEAKEEAAFVSACAIAYIMHYGNGKMAFYKCLKQANVSDSRVKSLISNKFVDKDGFFHAKYSRLVRFAVSKGFLPDVNEIYPALTNWWKYRITFIKNFFDENDNKNNK